MQGCSAARERAHCSTPTAWYHVPAGFTLSSSWLRHGSDRCLAQLSQMQHTQHNAARMPSPETQAGFVLTRHLWGCTAFNCRAAVRSQVRSAPAARAPLGARNWCQRWRVVLQGCSASGIFYFLRTLLTIGTVCKACKSAVSRVGPPSLWKCELVAVSHTSASSMIE